MCSMMASKLISNGVPNLKHGLAAVVERYLGRELSKDAGKRLVRASA